MSISSGTLSALRGQEVMSAWLTAVLPDLLLGEGILILVKGISQFSSFGGIFSWLCYSFTVRESHFNIMAASNENLWCPWSQLVYLSWSQGVRNWQGKLGSTKASHGDPVPKTPVHHAHDLGKWNVCKQPQSYSSFFTDSFSHSLMYLFTQQNCVF